MLLLLRSLALLILPALPAGAQTVYSLALADCSLATNDGALMLGPGRMQFHEATCTRTSPRRALGDGWNEADWTCEGEGEAWTRRIALRILSDRVQMREGERTTEFLACP